VETLFDFEIHHWLRKKSRKIVVAKEYVVGWSLGRGRAIVSFRRVCNPPTTGYVRADHCGLERLSTVDPPAPTHLLRSESVLAISRLPS
jgi:hypothetical protein